MNKLFLILLALITIASTCNLNAFQNEFCTDKDTVVTADSVITENYNKKYEIPWENTLYVIGSIGSQYTYRLELGYNISDVISFAFNIGEISTYTRGSQSAIGLLIKVHVPINYSFSPFILFGTGGQVPFSEATFSYNMIYGGLKITIARWLQLSPELGIIFVKETFSGEGIYNDLNISKSKLGLNLSIEIDFRQIF